MQIGMTTYRKIRILTKKKQVTTFNLPKHTCFQHNKHRNAENKCTYLSKSMSYLSITFRGVGNWNLSISSLKDQERFLFKCQQTKKNLKMRHDRQWAGRTLPGRFHLGRRVDSSCRPAPSRSRSRPLWVACSLRHCAAVKKNFTTFSSSHYLALHNERLLECRKRYNKRGKEKNRDMCIFK